MDKKTMDRREFLRDLGVAGAFLVSSPWLKTFADAPDTVNEKLRIGMIGPGSRGQFHLNFLKDIPQADVVAFADIYQPSLDAAVKIFPKARCYKDYRALLEDPQVDAVMVTTPLDCHCQQVLDSFDAGKHVFCEKTIGYDMEQSFRMYQKFKESGKVFLIGQQRLFDPRYVKAMELVHRGTIGKVAAINAYWNRNNDWRRPVPSPELEEHINWRLYKKHSKGLMTELCSHQVQIGTWALRQLPSKVMGTGAITYWKDGREVYDNLHLIYLYPDGVQMTYASVISNKFYGLEEQIMGNLGTIEPEKGKYYFEDVDPAPAFLRMVNEWENKVFDAMPFAGTSWAPETSGTNHGEYILGKRPKTDGTSLLDEAFVQAAITGKQPPMIAEEGYYSAILSLWGHEAIGSGQVLDFPKQYRIDYI